MRITSNPYKQLALLMVISNLSYAIDTKETTYCPKTYSLKKNKLTWSSKVNSINWKSTEPSLSTDAVTFLGAQWNGIKIGEISCVYQGSDELSFPIVLKNTYVFKQPKQGKWEVDDMGIYTCHSEDIKDCPLYPNIEKQAKVDIHKLMKEIKP